MWGWDVELGLQKGRAAGGWAPLPSEGANLPSCQVGVQTANFYLV